MPQLQQKRIFKKNPDTKKVPSQKRKDTFLHQIHRLVAKLITPFPNLFYDFCSKINCNKKNSNQKK